MGGSGIDPWYEASRDPAGIRRDARSLAEATPTSPDLDGRSLDDVPLCSRCGAALEAADTGWGGGRLSDRQVEALAALEIPTRPKGGDHYVLRVVGDSMVEEGIYAGDYVVLLRRERAHPGEMVCVLVGDEATLKRWHPEEDGQHVRLQSANRDTQPIRVPLAAVKVQGIVVGLMRKF